MNLFNIQNSFEQKKDRGWSTLYVVVDAHGTLIRPYHHKIEFYPDAISVMRWFSSRPDFKIILWTSSYPAEVNDLVVEAAKQNIKFDFVNANPIEANSPRADFSSKFYFNILIENKAGFSPEDGDWFKIKNELIRLGEWEKCGDGGDHKWGTDGQHSNTFCKKCFINQP